MWMNVCIYMQCTMCKQEHEIFLNNKLHFKTLLSFTMEACTVQSLLKSNDNTSVGTPMYFYWRKVIYRPSAHNAINYFRISIIVSLHIFGILLGTSILIQMLIPSQLLAISLKSCPISVLRLCIWH